jgi:hypothetical protein
MAGDAADDVFDADFGRQQTWKTMKSAGCRPCPRCSGEGIIGGRDYPDGSTSTLKDCPKCFGGGWRWHKWGPYIGTQEPKCEYIHDEPEIEEVFTYHVYELKQ